MLNVVKRQGKIYALVNLLTCQVYVGSTFRTIQERAKQRKTNYNRWLQGKFTMYKHNHKLFENIYEYGWHSFLYYDLETVSTNDPRELREREQWWIQRLNASLNSKRENVAKNTVKCSQEHHHLYKCPFCNFKTMRKTEMLKHLIAFELQNYNDGNNKVNESSSQDSTHTATIIEPISAG